MARKSITFTDRQEQWIDREAKRLGIKDSEIVRRAFDSIIDGTPIHLPGASVADPVDTTDDQAVYDTSHTGGTKMIRMWRITAEKITSLRRRYPQFTQIALIDHLVSAPEELLEQILTNSYAPTVTVTEVSKPELIPLPNNPDHIDLFLHKYCVKGRGLACKMAHIYESYKHSIGIENTPEKSMIFWDRVCEIGGVYLNRGQGTAHGIGLRPTAWAVIKQEAVGVEVEE